MRALRVVGRPLVCGLLSVLICGIAAACSTDSVPDAEDQAPLVEAGVRPAQDGASTADASPFDGADRCASHTVCGARAACCAPGEECVDSACTTACASSVRCGRGCCGTGEVCLGAVCVAPGRACNDAVDCDPGDFCEPLVRRCLPQPAAAETCRALVQPASFDAVMAWSWTGSATKPEFDQVGNIPLVVDLDGDRLPEVVVVTSRRDAPFDQGGKAFLRALDGRTGAEKWPATADVFKEGLAADPDYTVNPRGAPAAADLDGDGRVEIVVPRRGGGVLAFDGDGTFRWRSRLQNGTTPYDGNFNAVTVALADMDGDGLGEVVLGGVVLDHTGKLVSDVSVGRERWGAGDASHGATSILADIDPDSTRHDLFVVTGNRAVRKDGTLAWDVSATTSDGYGALADLDGDGAPELVVTYVEAGIAKIRVQNAATGARIGQVVNVPGQGRGGPPVLADLDGDGFVEIAAANGNKFSAFELDRETKLLAVKWSRDTLAAATAVSGSSGFDFDADGRSEVLHNDSCVARVLDGRDGHTLLELPNSTATLHEFPLVADVDGDDRGDLVLVANDREHLLGSPACAALDGGAYRARHGVFVYRDAAKRWARTRRMWNQHAYHVGNVTSDGKLPRSASASASRSSGPGLDAYRVSSSGAGAFNAPDLRVDLEGSTAACPAGLELRARVKNVGSAAVPAGVTVTFRRGASADGSVLGVSSTSRALLPGESQISTLVTSATDGAEGFSVSVQGTGSLVEECRADNNAAILGSVTCARPR